MSSGPARAADTIAPSQTLPAIETTHKYFMARYLLQKT